MLDAKVASALKRIIAMQYFKKRVSLAEQKAQMQDRILRGIQIACMIYEHFRVTGAHEGVLDFSDLLSVTVHGDDKEDWSRKVLLLY